MVTALLFASLVSAQTMQTTDDVWIYPHAYDQTGDPLLRVWGDGASSVGSPEDAGFSYSILRFDLTTVKQPAATLKTATLVLWIDGETTMTADESKKSPLEVRPVDATFDEKKWTFEQFSAHMPVTSEAALFGKGIATPSLDRSPFKMSINLLTGKGDFKKALEGKKAIGLALSSKIEAGGPDGPYYRIHSRSSEEKYRPTLVLEFND